MFALNRIILKQRSRLEANDNMSRQKPKVSKSYSDDKVQLQTVTDELYDLYTSKLSFDGNLPSVIISTRVGSGDALSVPANNSVGWKLVGISLVFVEDNATVTSIQYGSNSITPVFSDGASHVVTVVAFYN